MNYFRITAYHPIKDRSIIMDSFGRFEKLWQFSSELIQKGFQIIEVANASKFLDGNFDKTGEDKDTLLLRAFGAGKPANIVCEHGDEIYHAIKVANKVYIPDRAKIFEGGAV